MAIEAEDLSIYAAHLVSHAADMGGWLGDGYVNLKREYQAAAQQLTNHCKPPLFQHVKEGRAWVYWLTPAGLVVAVKLANATTRR